MYSVQYLHKDLTNFIFEGGAVAVETVVVSHWATSYQNGTSVDQWILLDNVSLHFQVQDYHIFVFEFENWMLLIHNYVGYSKVPIHHLHSKIVAMYTILGA